MKIEKVFYTDGEQKLGYITLGIAKDRWSKFSNENYKKLMQYKASIGIGWEYHNEVKDLREVEIFEKGRNLSAYPAPTMKYMVVIFDRESAYYPHPNNLVVFCPNGNVAFPKNVALPLLGHH